MSAFQATPLVSAEWVADHLGDPDVVLIEVDEQPLIYRVGHIPGAHLIDWRVDLRDPVTRDLPAAPAIRNLWQRLGITTASTVIFYGDKNNWHACFAYWLFCFYGLKRIALLDGGRQIWVTAGRALSGETPTASDRLRTPNPRAQSDLRALWSDVLSAARSGLPLLDVRTSAEYRGEVLSEPGYPDEAAQRAGHIPGAVNVPWDRATDADGRFLPRPRLRQLYLEAGVSEHDPVITYCRIGERSAHTWFVLHELLDQTNVRNYDGSWTEWGSMVAMPIAIGPDPGAITGARSPISLGIAGPPK